MHLFHPSHRLSCSIAKEIVTVYIIIAGDTSQQAVAASKRKSKDLQPPYNVVITGGTKGVAPSTLAVGGCICNLTADA